MTAVLLIVISVLVILVVLLCREMDQLERALRMQIALAENAKRRAEQLERARDRRDGVFR